MKKILLLQTGGTIAMHFDQNGEALDPKKWSDVLYKEMPELLKIAEIDIQNVFFEDSSNINRNHWKELSKLVDHQYDNYDGFVILHGTDTMAYTASALSFALRNLSKPVILTGSQVPMSNTRSDARRNLINSIELATYPVPEVAICFNDHLYRGNRSTKMSIDDFDAFASPNYPFLAEIGIHIILSNYLLEVPSKERHCFSSFDDSVEVVKIHPNLNPKNLEHIDLDETKAVILEAFGTGNIPAKGTYNLLPFVEICRNRNIQVIVTSQAPYDSVDLTQYSSGRAMKELGALSAREMTLEATLTKTMNLLAQDLTKAKFVEQFNRSLAGEKS